MPHRFDVKVRFSELDPYNHVNHTVYLTYCETARIEVLDEVGWSMGRLEAEGFHIVVTDFTARYRAAAELGDELTVETDVSDVKRSTSIWNQTIHRGDELMFSVELRGAIIDLDGKPRRFPDGLAEALKPYRTDL